MSDPKNQGLDGLLGGLGQIFRQFSDLSDNLKKKAEDRGEGPVVEKRVTIRTMDGEEIDSSFFGVSPQPTAAEASTELELRQAPVEFMEQDELLTALVEMPGAAAETLDLLIDGDMLTVRAKSGSVEYHAEAILPAAVEPASQTVSLRNGVLEATWRRRPGAKAESRAQ